IDDVFAEDHSELGAGHPQLGHRSHRDFDVRREFVRDGGDAEELGHEVCIVSLSAPLRSRPGSVGWHSMTGIYNTFMDSANEKIRITIFIGSVRPGNYTSMAAALVADEFKKHPEVAAEVIDPATLNLSLPGAPEDPKIARHLQQKVTHSA